MDRELLILGLLRHQEMHGYQLHEFIEGPLAFCTDLKRPTAYFLLDKLAERGLVTEKETREGHRPVRKVYGLTSQGEAAFQRLLRESLAAYAPARFSSDISLAYLDDIDPGEALILLRERRETVAASAERAEAAPAHAGSLQWVVEHQARHLRAEVEWLDEIINRLTEKVRPQAR